MTNVYLINRAQLQLYKQFSNTSYDDKLKQMIIEAQMQDIKPLLGRDLFNDVMIDARDNNGLKYKDLLEGVTYTDCRGIERDSLGLRVVLAEYVYGRKLMFGDVIDNPFGFTKKSNNQSSELLSISEKKTNYNNNRQFAFDLWLEVKAYILHTGYEYFNCSTKSKPSRRARAFKVGVNHKRRRFK